MPVEQAQEEINQDSIMKLNVVITGSTGMVGEGVLHECLNHHSVEKVLVINRRPCGLAHPKLSEVIHPDFLDTEGLGEKLVGYNACYFCAGMSSVGKPAEEYERMTYDLTIGFAKVFLAANPLSFFCYVSGEGTDSSEQGRLRWARVKGKTENMLMQMPFVSATMFRPGYIQPTPGLKNTYKILKWIAPLFPLWQILFPRHVCTLAELGSAMINVTLSPDAKRILEPPDIRRRAKE